MTYQSEKGPSVESARSIVEREKEMKLSEWQTFYGLDDDIPPAGPGVQRMVEGAAAAGAGITGAAGTRGGLSCHAILCKMSLMLTILYAPPFGLKRQVLTL